jgi:kynurenine formamidase
MPMPEAFYELARKVNNWGRWGPDDEIGTLNLITDDVVRRGVAAATAGRRIPLSFPYAAEGPQAAGAPGRFNPLRTMIAINDPQVGDPDGFRSNDDIVTMPLQASTHWDSLAHVTYQGRMWNGVSPETDVDFNGAHKCGIDKVGPLVGRGVLLDVARAKGVDKLEPGHPVTPDDLDEAAEFGRVTVEPGDCILIRTGQARNFHAGDVMGYIYPAAGPVMATSGWFREHDVAAVAVDNYTFEAYPGVPPDAVLAVHLIDIVEIGLTQGQNFDLEELSAACADDGSYEFLLTATPLPFRRGCGGPCAPVAIK